MRLFRRSEGAPGAHPITDFWTWWAEQGHDIDPQRESSLADELTRRLGAVHPDLTWHFGAGTASEHRLTVSADGIAAVRPAAERWLRAAPQADSTWEFRSSKEAEPDALEGTIGIAGHHVDLSTTEFRVEVDAEDLRVHVGVYNPAFGELPEGASGHVTFLVLDWLLGEDDVERWLGEVVPLSDPPGSARSGDELLAAVQQLATDRESAEWAIAQWQDQDGIAGMAVFRRGLRWIDAPTLDRHQIVSAAYSELENRLPDPTGLDALRQLESELEEILGSRGVLVAFETHRGVRTFHVYTDGEDQNVDAALGDWVKSRGLALESRLDPAWSEVRRFTG